MLFRKLIKPVDIILVKYNLPEMAKKCVESVLQYTNDIHYNLTIYDNFPLNENLGKLWNRLIKPLQSDYFVLLNDDTIVEEDWLGKLIEVFKKENNAGAVGPTTNNCHNPQNSEPRTFSYDVVDFSKTYPKFVLSGFCLALDRKKFDEVGGFPEDFGFYGQETAMLDKMEAKGIRQYWRKDVFVYHFGSASAKKASLEGKLDDIKERKIGNVRVKELRDKLGLWK